MAMNTKVSILNSAAVLFFSTWSSPAASTNVNYGSFFFNPPIVRITAGDTVNWTGGGGHTLLGTSSDPICGGGLLPCSHTFNTPGNYTYLCTVGNHAALGMTGLVVVVAAPNLPPSVTITNPVDQATFSVGTDILVQAAASDSDGISHVDFFANGGPIGSSVVSPYSATLASPAPGTYALTATAFDTLGASSTSQPVTITVQAAHVPPSISITNPTDGQIFFAGTNALIEVSVSSGVSSVQFFTNGVSAGVSSSAPFSLLLPNLALGTYVLTVIATDNLGTNGTSAPVRISVITPPQSPIILTQPQSQTVTTASNVFFSVSAGGTDPLFFQWKFNGIDIPSATTRALAVINVQEANQGSYSVTVSNAFGTTNSSPALLTVQPPANLPPVVAITNPPSGTKFPAHSDVTIIANAFSPNGTIAQVEFFVRTNSLRTNFLGSASTAPFSIVLTNLSLGTNFVSARATDNTGLKTTSSEIVVIGINGPTVTLTASSINSVQLGTDILLAATASSAGSTITNTAIFEGSTALVQGPTNSVSVSIRPSVPRDYSFTAVATDALGQSSNSAPIVIRVFLPQPFSALAGNYTGLFLNTNQLSVEDSGLLTLKLNKKGAFSGKISMNGAKYGFRGQFDQFGRINLPVIRSARKPMVLNMHLDLSGDSDQIDGTASTAVGTNLLIATLLADRNVFNAHTNPAPQAGHRAFILQPAPDFAGHSVGLVQTTVSASGTTKIHGSLNSGQKFSLSTASSKDGFVPLYVSLTRGSEAMVGWLHFGKAQNDLSGSMLWDVTSSPTQTSVPIQVTPASTSPSAKSGPY